MVLLLLMQYLEASFPKDRKAAEGSTEEDNEGKNYCAVCAFKSHHFPRIIYL